jgi:hypothetical protein
MKIAMKRKLFLPTAVPRRQDENVYELSNRSINDTIIIYSQDKPFGAQKRLSVVNNLKTRNHLIA